MIRNLLTDRNNWEQIAVIEEDYNGEHKTSYRALAETAYAIQQFFHQRKKHTAGAGIFLSNGADYIAAFYGTAMLGMTVFPLNIFMTKHEILPLLRQTSIDIMITSKQFQSLFRDIWKQEDPDLEILYVEDLQCDKGGKLPELVSMRTDQPMVFLNTSGTTGKAKIVQLSEQNIESSVLGYLDKMNFQDGDRDMRYILASPFFSAYGIMIVTACLIQSYPIILLEDNFTLDILYKMAEKHKATHYEGGALVLLLMEQMAGRPIPYDLHTLKWFGFGGSKVSEKTLKVLMEAYPEFGFFQGYGMTEAAPLITKHPCTRLEKPASVGPGIKDVELAVSTEGEITRQPYRTGEILVKGPNVMLGYYRDETATRQVIQNGYLYTGDVGYLDEEGYLYICGRKKNVIIVRGFNVYAEEVEACLLACPLVKDCFVYGEAEYAGYEIVCAEIVPAHTEVKESVIRAYCDLHLSKEKRPQIIRFCSEIQKTATGKTERGRGGK